MTLQHSYKLPRVLLIGVSDRLAQIQRELRERNLARGVYRIDSIEDLADLTLDRFDLVMFQDGASDAPALRIVRSIRSQRENISIIVLLTDRNPTLACQVIEAGARDCASLDEAIEDLGTLLAKNRGRVHRHYGQQRLIREMQTAVRHARRKIGQLEEHVAQLETMVWTDSLTGLANRRHLEERLPQVFAEAARYGSDLTCMMIDLDGFKQINDTFGHARGDDLLRLTGEIIAAEVRSADIAARYGGDEFVILLPQTGAETGASLAQRLTEAFQHQVSTIAEEEIRCGISIGVASMKFSQPMSGAELVAHADNALYAAKQAGKSRTMICGADGVNAVEPLAA